MSKIIYLDQNIWIYLSHAYYQNKKYGDIALICENLLKKSVSGDLIFPVSIVHIIETYHIQDPKKRDKLIDFMLKLSNGYTIPPYLSLTDIEIRNSIFKRLNLPTTDLINIVIRKGISSIFGSKLDIIGKFPENIEKAQIELLEIPESLKKKLLLDIDKSKTIKDSIIEWLDSLDGISWVFKNSEIFNENGEDSIDNSIEEIEKIRSKYKRIEDKNMRYKVVLLENFRSVISPRIREICNELGISEDAIFPKEWTKMDWINFIEDIPTFYVLFNLSYKREIYFERPITRNDEYDINSMAIAIPYCDIIVAEKMFSSIAKQTKLDEIYNTIILSSIKDLEQYV